MFLHIGGDVVVFINDLIAILDFERCTISKDTKNFLKISEEEGFIEAIGDDLPKSFIVVEIDNKSKIYLSPISCATLIKRFNKISEIY